MASQFLFAKIVHKYEVIKEKMFERASEMCWNWECFHLCWGCVIFTNSIFTFSTKLSGIGHASVFFFNRSFLVLEQCFQVPSARLFFPRSFLFQLFHPCSVPFFVFLIENGSENGSNEWVESGLGGRNWVGERVGKGRYNTANGQPHQIERISCIQINYNSTILSHFYYF